MVRRLHPQKGVHSLASPHTGLSDDDLLELVQRQTFRYFKDFARPESGLIVDRSNSESGFGPNAVAIGGSGFGIMAIVVAAERNWISRQDAVAWLLRIVRFLGHAKSYHGIFPHLLHGATGETIPFGALDDGGDLVESSYLFSGLLSARQYFDRDNELEKELRGRITALWHAAEWTWYTRGGDVLYWHWSPRHDWTLNLEIRGWNECLITYVLAASSPRFTIGADVYHRGWAGGFHFRNGRQFYGITLPLGPDFGGPLCFAHCSFLGLDPSGLRDRYADYWQQNVHHTLINREHCIRNPHAFQGYGPDCWGLTSSDGPSGYAVHSPDRDLGVIAPTAALSSFPYTPHYSMQALRHFYEEMGYATWREHGFIDAFNEAQKWYAVSHLTIDQGPIIVMIENHRTGLLWRLFMSCPEVQSGLAALGFERDVQAAAAARV